QSACKATLIREPLSPSGPEATSFASRARPTTYPARRRFEAKATRTGDGPAGRRGRRAAGAPDESAGGGHGQLDRAPLGARRVHPRERGTARRGDGGVGRAEGEGRRRGGRRVERDGREVD